MKTLLIVLGLSGAAAAQAREPGAYRVQGQEPARPGEIPKLKGTERPPQVSARGGIEVSYDDNILDLSEKQLEQLRDGTRPEKFRIEEEDDFIYSAWAELEVKAWLLGRPSSLGLKIQPYYYQENSIANYEEYRAFLTHGLGRHEAGIEYVLERDVYHRELEIVVPGPNLWESAYYSEHDAEIYSRLAFHDAFSTRVFGGARARDFDSPFGYRDLEGFFVGVRPTLTLAKGWSAFAKYEYSDLESNAHGIETDTSYVQHEIELGLGATLLDKTLDLSIRQRWGFREYTTDKDPSVDPDHVDREDRRLRTVLQARLRLAKSWSLEGRYIRRTEDSDRPFNGTDTGEAVGSERQVFTVGLSVDF
jgi:hypothetical protein